MSGSDDYSVAEPKRSETTGSRKLHNMGGS